MAKSRIKPYYLVDPETGESFGVLVGKLQGNLGRKWMRLFQDTKQQLLREHPELYGSSLRVLSFLETYATWENRVPTPTVLAETLEMNRSSVSRSYGQLLKAGFLIKWGGEYRLSPLVYWKGNERQYNELMEELSGHVRPAIAEPRATYYTKSGK